MNWFSEYEVHYGLQIHYVSLEKDGCASHIISFIDTVWVIHKSVDGNSDRWVDILR